MRRWLPQVSLVLAGLIFGGAQSSAAPLENTPEAKILFASARALGDVIAKDQDYDFQDRLAFRKLEIYLARISEFMTSPSRTAQRHTPLHYANVVTESIDLIVSRLPKDSKMRSFFFEEVTRVTQEAKLSLQQQHKTRRSQRRDDIREIAASFVLVVTAPLTFWATKLALVSHMSIPAASIIATVVGVAGGVSAGDLVLRLGRDKIAKRIVKLASVIKLLQSNCPQQLAP